MDEIKHPDDLWRVTQPAPADAIRLLGEASREAGYLRGVIEGHIMRLRTSVFAVAQDWADDLERALKEARR